MKICIIGAGAMGGLYGTRLIMAGEEVHFVDNRQSVVDNINQQGVHLTGVDGEHWIPAKASVTASDFFPADIAFIHTDTNNSAAAAKQANAVPDKQDFIPMRVKPGLVNSIDNQANESTRSRQPYQMPALMFKSPTISLQ